ncbi:type VII secretion integral membrane protein EccD [Saccharopolyspora antimicrobica]|uniref:Type VII secretion integral membrane protein EccD n=1 Tax=Saccharopolyspora antimicrobica TaxID=455193 RepID=A0A1I5B389_9PSEU|nr:type VII secretion integral membrane protein EccD [Saccharopolyspora antimicrobica]RKT86449.1 type VII secretion integral membrane protein EccD [Saccharopolyspora antimicrobica]SFN68989.1 type VII secretion integral membrane protein EccD [Saccharopolyspora antimicrobica]
MTSAAELCRITVFGPDGKADLAVPVSTTVADLLPVLLSHTQQQPRTDEQGSWVLQRLGGAALDPAGTPETLDWLEGEQLHLRPADDPLPELDFDDLADGIATSVGQRKDRWKHENSRVLFKTLSAAVVAVIGLILLGPGPTGLHAGFALGLAVVFAAAAAPVARKLDDLGLTRLTGLAACALAGLAGLIAADGVPGATAPTPSGILVGAAGSAVAAAVLLVLRRFAANDIPYAPFITVLLIAATVIGGVWLGAGFGLTIGQVAGVLATVLFGVVVFAPKLTIRAAYLRGPQLPRNADDLQQDIDPAPADEVFTRTAAADRYMSVAMVVAATVFVGAFPFILAEPGWVSWTLVILLACAVLLRSRSFLGVWQRVSLAVAGTAGLSLVVLQFAREFSPGWRTVVLLSLLLVLFALVKAALRPATRRMLPIWGHLANIFDTCTALAVVPLLLQLLGVYAWARGLAG